MTGEHDAGNWEEGGKKNWQDFVAEPEMTICQSIQVHRG